MSFHANRSVAIIGSVGLPANYGGFETLVNFLTRENSRIFDITVFCQKNASRQKPRKYNNSKLRYLPFRANGIQSVLYDVISICISWSQYDSLLILGTSGCIILPLLRLLKKKHVVLNFGSLEWKREKWGRFTQWYLKFSEGIAIRNSDVIICDNQYLCDYVREEYKRDSILIEYGGDYTDSMAYDSSMMGKYPFLTRNYDISVSRAQSDNQLHLLLEVYRNTPQRNLVLVSNYYNSRYGLELKEKYSNIPNIFLQDAVYDLKELNVIRSNAKLYIHSHSLCGTAPSLVEAMLLGLPVVAYDVPANRYTTENKALYFKNASELQKIIDSLDENTSRKIGNNMKEIATRRYTWKRIAQMYAAYL